MPTYRLTAATCRQTHLFCCCSTLPSLPFIWWIALLWFLWLTVAVVRSALPCDLQRKMRHISHSPDETGEACVNKCVRLNVPSLSLPLWHGKQLHLWKGLPSWLCFSSFEWFSETTGVVSGSFGKSCFLLVNLPFLCLVAALVSFHLSLSLLWSWQFQACWRDYFVIQIYQSFVLGIYF